MFAFGSKSIPLPQSKRLILKRLCLKRLTILGDLIFFRGREDWLNLCCLTLMVWYTYDVHFEGGGGRVGVDKNEMLSDVWGWGIRECSGVQFLFFFIKENWICAMTKQHAQPNINILLTRNLHFYSDLRQWSHWNWTSKVKGMEEFWTLIGQFLWTSSVYRT